MPHHFFTVDVEEYFQVSAFEGVVPRANWESYESRVSRGVDRILELLDRYNARGTFFVLGWVAERHPEIVRAIARAHHEIASHGWDHRKVTDQDQWEFRESVKHSKQVLEDLCGRQVIGFRAPSFSIVPGREWALDVLVEEGYHYDSSLFPVRRLGYGYARGGRDPYWVSTSSGRLREYPPATLRAFGYNLPAGGGASLRIFPYQLVQAALADSERRGVAATLYVHPWELDAKQPRLNVSLSARLRHYTGLERTAPRLQRLLSEFRFTAIADPVAIPERVEMAVVAGR